MQDPSIPPYDDTPENDIQAPIMETLGVSRVYRVGGEMITSVSDVTLQIGYGDFVVIFGPSGAGKSTLIGMLMGLEQPDVGEVFLKGKSLFGYKEEQRTVIRRKKVSYLPQSQCWIDTMGIVDNVALPLYLIGWSRSKARKRAKELLIEVGLESELNRHPNELSSGQQQKAALARAIIKEPWLIFADEPTAHLDSKSVEEVTSIMLDASKRHGITIVMVTHDLSFLKLSKKWFFMRDGRLWDIEDRDDPFTNIRDAIDYIENEKKDMGTS